eukprot:328834-Amphidinium_carterae.1
MPSARFTPLPRDVRAIYGQYINDCDKVAYSKGNGGSIALDLQGRSLGIDRLPQGKDPPRKTHIIII